MGQALGLVLSKFGLKDYDPFAATQIRIIAGVAGYILLVTILMRWRSVFKATRNKEDAFDKSWCLFLDHF